MSTFDPRAFREYCLSGIGIYYPGMVPVKRIGVKIDYVVEPDFEKDGIKKGDLFSKTTI